MMLYPLRNLPIQKTSIWQKAQVWVYRLVGLSAVLVGCHTAHAQETTLQHPSGVTLEGGRWSASGPALVNAQFPATVAGTYQFQMPWPSGTQPGPIPASLHCVSTNDAKTTLISRLSPVTKDNVTTIPLNVIPGVSQCQVVVSVVATQQTGAYPAFTWVVNREGQRVTGGSLTTRLLAPPQYTLSQRWLDAQGFAITQAQAGDSIFLEVSLQKIAGNDDTRIKIPWQLPSNLQIDRQQHPTNRNNGESVQSKGCVVVDATGQGFVTHLGKDVCRVTRIGFVAKAPGQVTDTGVLPDMARSLLFVKVRLLNKPTLNIQPASKGCLAVQAANTLSVPTGMQWQQQLSFSNSGSVPLWAISWKATHDQQPGWTYQFGTVPPEPTLQDAWDRFMAARPALAPGEQVTLNIVAPTLQQSLTENLQAEVPHGCSIQHTMTVDALPQ